MYEKASVTSLKHHLLASLGPAPFADLCATDHHENTELYSFDVFRRLYNDAVESMLYYQKLAQTSQEQADAYSHRCQELEYRLMELCCPDDEV